VSAGQRTVLVTGGAGFIGSHLVDSLLSKGNRIVVLDNFNEFYDPGRKRRNIKEHLANPLYRLVEGDLRNDLVMDQVFGEEQFDVVVHLAAMAGVRPSMSAPQLYMDVNVNGTQKLLDRMIAQKRQPKLVFGSSSSVYGNRSGEFFQECDRVDQPLSPYAASKGAGELICYAAHYTTGLPVVCLRFFTVFGPRQRPDLAIHKFCHLIDEGQPIQVFGDGTSKRDYTFVADIVSGIEKSMNYEAKAFDIFNLGRSDPVLLNDMIGLLEQALGKKAAIEHKPMQTGDMPYTFASIDKAREALDYEPTVSFPEGVKRFVAWYLENKAVVV
jgi:UDP-glucuronate 4-epimerase